MPTIITSSIATTPPHLSLPPSSTTATATSTPTHNNHIPFNPINRRHLIAALSLSITITPPLSPPPTLARGLFQMPPARLTNRYYLVRAGESGYESIGVINTNPVAKTSVDSGLSERGKRQTVKAALELKAMGACDNGCWIWPSITQRAYQAAEIIAAVNGISRR